MRTLAKSKDKDITLKFIGGNSYGVTGSSTLVTTANHTYMLECGMVQGGTVLDDYRDNSKFIRGVKAKTIEYIFVLHSHIDHCGLLPALFARNCDATIIVPENSTPIIAEILRDSARIMERDIAQISAMAGRECEVLYTLDDVENAISHIREVPMHEVAEITEELAVEFIPSGHIAFGASAEFFFDVNGKRKTIWYTSDLGNNVIEDYKFFVDKFESIKKGADIVISEATYGNPERKQATAKTIKKDLEKVESTIRQFTGMGGRVLIPCFSLDRTPFILSILYNIFAKDESFNVPIIIDSPLSNRLLDIYNNILEGDAKDRFEEMLNWKNIVRVVDAEHSKALVSGGKSAVILASSGMIVNGSRSAQWLKSILPNPQDCVMFCGFCSPNSIGYRIKNDRQYRTIDIGGKEFANRCAVVNLVSFSSHMQFEQLKELLSNTIRTNDIYLVHSDMNDRIIFKRELEESLRQNLRSTKVHAVNKDTKINL